MTNLLAAIASGGLMMHVIYLLLALLVLYLVLWGIETLISPIPPQIKMVLAVIVLIVAIFWLFGGM